MVVLLTGVLTIIRKLKIMTIYNTKHGSIDDDDYKVFFKAETILGKSYPHLEAPGIEWALKEMRLRNGRPWKDNEETEMREQLIDKMWADKLSVEQELKSDDRWEA